MWAKRWLLLGSAVALLAVGCSSSSKSSSSGTTAAPSGGTTAGSAAGSSSGSSGGASGSEYVIGNIGTYSGAVSGDYGSDRQVLNAWVSSVNDSGGINGHKVKLVSLDDQGNPTNAIQDAEQLVQQDHVLAVVDENSNGGAAYSTYLQQQKVPVIGATSNPPATTDDYFFPVGTGTIGITIAEVGTAKMVNANKIAFVYCAESPVCAQAVGFIKQVASGSGVDVSYTSSAPESAPSYTSYCLAAKQSGAGAIIPALASPAVIGLANDCAQQGYHVTFLVGGAPVGPELAQASGLAGAIALEGVFSWVDNSLPAEQAFHSALQKYAPSVLTSQTYNATTANSWADAEMFRAAAEQMQGNSPAALVTALDGLKSVTLGGLIGSQSYAAGTQANPTCVSLTKLESGKWTPMNPGQFTCSPPSGT